MRFFILLSFLFLLPAAVHAQEDQSQFLFGPESDAQKKAIHDNFKYEEDEQKEFKSLHNSDGCKTKFSSKWWTMHGATVRDLSDDEKNHVIKYLDKTQENVDENTKNLIHSPGVFAYQNASYFEGQADPNQGAIEFLDSSHHCVIFKISGSSVLMYKIIKGTWHLAVN